MRQMIAQLFNRLINSQNVTYSRWPQSAGTNAAAGVKTTAGATPAWGSYAQIVAAAKVGNPFWLSDIFTDNPDNAAAAETWHIDIGVGGAGVELAISTGATTIGGVFSFTQAWISSVGSWVSPMFKLDPQIKIAGAPRLAAVAAGGIVGAKNIYVAVGGFANVGN